MQTGNGLLWPRVSLIKQDLALNVMAHLENITSREEWIAACATTRLKTTLDKRRIFLTESFLYNRRKQGQAIFTFLALFLFVVSRIILNSSFSENSAFYRGAIEIQQFNSESSLVDVKIDKCEFNGNAVDRGGNLLINGFVDDFIISNCLYIVYILC